MIKFENTEVFGWKAAIRGLRNPLSSWDKSDSHDCAELACKQCPFESTEKCGGETGAYYVIGDNDLDLMKRLRNAGTDHRKYLRMITVYVDITAPRMWFTEFDTYKVGTVVNSCSTMHTIHKKPFELSDFSLDEIMILNKKPEQVFVPFDVENEEWKEISSIPNVLVSNTGRVKTKAYEYQLNDGRVFHYKEKEISVHEDNGYMTCTIRMYGERYTCKLHRLMAEAFIPKVEGKPHINHKDGNKLNNNLYNLEWVSQSENSQHAQDNGLVFWTEEARNAVGESSRLLNDIEILNIIKLKMEGKTLTEIENEVGVSASIISRVCTGKYFSKRKTPLDIMKETIDELNELRELYLKTKNKIYWRMMIEMLPQSYNQKRTVMLNYEVLNNMHKSRKNHKLDEWSTGFVNWINTLPYAKELIIGGE